ncbi:hypothetical protein [Microtetraspora malaysiensis]
MKLLRVGPVGQERPVVMDAAGNLRDIGKPEIDELGRQRQTVGQA